ncbi:unnamed protein product [Paramecium sonneborni]|uniref:CCR4-NOT transcription complex subunit 11 n=1 Tax=Paramecium sonneborni TaxID=65129 RepID=A0A8S1KXQ4_9CILI|nr:unnamed protein product [Paramecium sonneborni]
MISQSEVESINKFLLESTGTLENIQKMFVKKFESEPNPYPYFYQGLCDNIFTKGQRLLSIYLLYNSELKSCLQDIYIFTQNDFEKKFILDPQIYAGITIKTLLEEQDKFTSNEKPSLKDQSQNQISQNKIRNCVSINNNNPPQKFRNNSTLIQQQNGFEIDYFRPIPITIQNKFDWIDLHEVSDNIWDYSLSINSDKLSQIKEIMSKAHMEQITEQEFQQFQEYLKKDNYNLLKNNGLINFNLSEIIEKNLNLAFFLFSKSFPNPEFFDLIDSLVQIDVTPNGLEIMCMIVQQFHIPQEYLNYYINYCIQFCQNIKEKGSQVRMIKYLTIFLKHLINKKMYKTSDLVTELQAFSIEFSNIGETSSLFKLIKSDKSDKSDTSQ